MTAAEYRAAGYNVSAHYEQALIDRAERVVRAAYIDPLMQGAEVEYNDVLLCLAYLYLLRQNATLTRAGGKVKLTDVSSVVSEWDAISQMNTECSLMLDTLRERCRAAGVVSVDSVEVHDINKIYFTTNYFGG